jgi:deoxyribose-phosphate aldolase
MDVPLLAPGIGLDHPGRRAVRAGAAGGNADLITIDRVTPDEIAATIEHTALAPATTERDIVALVAEAVERRFAAVCVAGRFVALARSEVDASRSPVRVCAVAGFPLGNSSVGAIAHEAAACVADGADDVDVVAWLPHLLGVRSAGDAPTAAAALAGELASIAERARRSRPVILKVILETAALRAASAGEDARFDAMLLAGRQAARAAGFDFVKTSTGVHAAGGASADAVRRLRSHAGGLRVKASGGIRTINDAMAMLGAGADRLGTSAGVAIVRGAGGATGGY